VKRLNISDHLRKTVPFLCAGLLLAVVTGAAYVCLNGIQFKLGPSSSQTSWQRPENGPPQANIDAPCLTAYTLFSGQAYYGTIPISEADVATFTALPPSNCIAYAKDRNHVYIGFMGFAYQIAPGADPNSFTPFSDVTGLIIYSKDSLHVYGTPDVAGLNTTETHIQVIPGADTATFKVLYDSDGYFTGYAKDDRHVYYLLQSLPNADPSNFVVLQGERTQSFPGAFQYTTGFARDKSHVYYGSYPILGADTNSFAPIYAEQSWTQYAKDKNYVYCETYSYPNPIIVLTDADPGTFVAESDAGGWNGYAQDQKHRWHMCTLIA
jgi:hypothetical protein